MPRIVKLIPRRRGQWIEVVPDAGASLKLPLHAVPAGLETGVVVDEPDWRALQQAAEYHVVYDRALRILGLREHFRRELEAKLFTRSRNGGLIRRVLDELVRREYLDDHRAAEQVAEFVTRRGGIGPQLLRLELSRRGCPPELLEELVTKHAAQMTEDDVVGKLLARKHGFFERKRDSLRAKLVAKLGNSGRIEPQLRAQLGLAVIAWLATRGFAGEEARNEGRRLVEELLA